MSPNQQPIPERSNIPASEVMPAIEANEALPAAPTPVEQVAAAPATPTFTSPAQVVADPTQTPAAADPATPSASTPVTANDQDKIEKEWVEVAEKVIKQTASDPYTEEEAVENLQADYLQKRYGREVKKPEGS